MPSTLRLAEALVDLAGALTGEIDLIELLHELCAHASDVLVFDAAGVLLASGDGKLRLVAASDERSRVLQVLQMEGGPGARAYDLGSVVFLADLDEDGACEDWKEFGGKARDAGYRSLCALPMRFKGQSVGALTLFSERPSACTDDELRSAQALADIATISLLHAKSLREAQTLTDELQTALNTRVNIEQAKGVIAERHGIGLDEAFHKLRRYCRERGLRLREVAAQVTDGSFDGQLDGPSPRVGQDAARTSSS